MNNNKMLKLYNDFLFLYNKYEKQHQEEKSKELKEANQQYRDIVYGEISGQRKIFMNFLDYIFKDYMD